MDHPDVSYPLDDSTPTSHLPFSPCVRVGNLLFVSGQASVDNRGKIISDDFESQFRRSIENLRAVLQTAGCDLGDVVQTRNYIHREEDFVTYNRLYAEYFEAPLPARTSIGNCLNDEVLYEVEAIAVVRHS